MELKEILEKHYKKTLKLFDRNYLDFVDSKSINKYLNKDILQIDKHSDILAVYKDKKNVEHSLKINKNNFYNGYADKIWKNLDIKEKAQIAKWHFDYLANRYNFKRVDFIFNITTKSQGIWNFAVTGRTHPIYNHSNPKKNKTIIEINPEQLFEENQYELSQIIEHEMQHLKQQYFSKSQYRLGADKLDVKDVYELDRVTLGNEMKLLLDDSEDSKDIKFVFYKTSLKEKAADLTGLKNTNKIYKANQNLKLTNKTDLLKIKDLNYDILLNNYKIKASKAKDLLEDKKDHYKMAYNTEKHSDELAELNSIGAILTAFGLTDTDVYQKLNDYTIDFMINLKWDEKTIKEIYQEVFKFDLKDTDLDYGTALKNFYHNKYEREEELSK